MTQISPETGLELVRRLVDSADRLGADMLVTVCPMCQMNVDAYQSEMNRHFGTTYHMPILFFTQLMGLAFGEAPDRLGLGREIVSARRALAKIGVELPAVEPANEQDGADRPRRPKRGPGLPMPQMPPTAETSRPSPEPPAPQVSDDAEPEP
jgi:heterodisulfide reductase subunit B